MSNEFDAAVAASLQPDQGQAARLGFSVAADTNPDTYAEARRVARRTGVPVSTVLAMPKEMKRQDAVGSIDFDTLAKTSPVTAALLADVEKAKLAHDDVHNMGEIERKLRQFAGGGVEAVGMAASGTGRLLDVAQRAMAGFAGSLLPKPMSGGEATLESLAGPMMGEGWQQGGNMAKSAARNDIKLPVNKQTFGDQVASGLGQVAAQIVMLPLMRGFGLYSQGADAIGEKIDRDNAPQWKKDLAVVGGAAVTGITEKWALDRLLEPIAVPIKNQIAASLARIGIAAAAEGGQEFSENVLHDVVRKTLTNSDAQVDFGQSLDEGGVGATVGGIVRSVIEAGLHVKTRVQRAQQAEHTAQTIAGLNELAQASKVLQRDPETFEQFIAHAAEGGPAQQVFIDANALMQSGLATQVIAASPSAAEQFKAAIDTGGQIAIPLEEYATRIAPTEFAQSLVEHLKTDPEGFSRFEAQQYMQTHADELRAETERVLTAKQDDDTFKQSAEVVRASVKTQLDAAARFTPHVNDAYSSMVGNFYAVQAAKLGTTPEELFQRYPLKINAEMPLGEHLNQDSHPENLLDLFNQAGNIKSQASEKTEQEIDDEQRVFLSAFPKSVATYRRSSGIARKIRKASDHAANSIGADPSTTRTVESPLGPFSQYEVIGQVLPGDAVHSPGGILKVAIYGKEQAEAGLVDEPALTFTVLNDGEISVNGPTPGNPTFDAFKDRGWADHAKAGDQIAEGWSSLTNLDGSKIPMAQVIDLLADVHARVRAWKMEGHTGLYWSRNTGALAGVGDYGSAIYLQNKAGNRGAYAPDTHTITLLKNADLSTFLHESGHHFLEMTAEMAAQSDAPESIKQDMQTLLDWFGVKDLTGWNGLDFEKKRVYHEKFARGFEAYLFEGKAPSIELQGLFQRFRAWMLNVYRDLKNLNIELTDEVRSVFDRMLASTEEIQLAEQGRSMMPLFSSLEQSGMTPEAFAAYHALGVDATNAAIEDLQARGLRDMQWLNNARGRIIQQLQKESEAKRAEVRREVAAEVNAQPIYRAERFLRYGELETDPDANRGQRRAAEQANIEGYKLSLPVLKEMYGDEANAIWRHLPVGKHGLAATEGMHPDMVAEIFGFSSGDQLVRELLNAEPRKSTIEALTDVRMLEQFGDLSSPEALEKAADKAIHNDARARFVATEANALAKATGQRRVLASAAKEFARVTVSRLKVRNIKPGQYASAEVRAAKAAEKASKAGDLATAAAEKRNQMIQIYATRAAYDAQEEVEKLRRQWAALAKRSDDKLVKAYDMDLFNAVRAILGQYGIAENKGKHAAEYLKTVQSHDPEMYAIVQASVEAAESNAKPFKDMAVEEVRGLAAELDAILHLARRSRQMEIDGDLIDRQEVEEALRNRMEEIGIPTAVPGEGQAMTKGEERLLKFKTLLAAATRVESWVGKMDGDAAMGPFRRYLWNRIKDSADAYRSDKGKYLKQFRDLFDSIAPSMKPGVLAAPELNYTFGKDSGGSAINEILHAILHTGNESNKRKLLLGRHWAQENPDGTLDTSRWDAFIKRMAAEGRVTKAHFDFAQGVWDLLDSMKPLAQKTHRDVFGKYFDEVTANPVSTPFGVYAGGYVPAMADSRVVTDAKLRALSEQENAGMAYAFPSTPKGFTKSRVEYNKPLLLDLRTLAQHIDKVLLFSHMEMPVRDVQRVINRVGGTLDRIDPAAIGGLLTPWLNRSARQQVVTPITNDGGLSRFLSVMRSRAGAAAMFGNFANAAQQITGFSLAAVKVKPKLLLSATADYMKHPRKFAEAVAEASPYMRERLASEVSAMNDDINAILLNPSLLEKGQAWTMRHAYFLQSAVDNAMSPIVWTAAYNQGLEQGLSHRDAVRLGDSAVRETQGSTLPEDVSRVETGNAFVRLFTQFAGYFNMQANLLGSEFAKIMRDYGLRKGAGKGIYVFLFGFLAPAVAAELIIQLFRGGPGDADDDGEYLDDWLAALFGWAPLRNATAMVPVAGSIINASVNAWNGKPYDDRIATSPAISMLESAVKAPVSVWDAAADDGSLQKAVRDVATLISMTLGLPANLAARPAGYAAGVADDHIEPTSAADAVRGAITGTASPASKR